MAAFLSSSIGTFKYFIICPSVTFPRYLTVYNSLKFLCKIIGTYYFNSKRSSESSILGKDDKVPGIWRSCDIAVQKGKHTYSIEVADEGKTILTRFILY